MKEILQVTALEVDDSNLHLVLKMNSKDVQLPIAAAFWSHVRLSVSRAFWDFA